MMWDSRRERRFRQIILRRQQRTLITRVQQREKVRASFSSMSQHADHSVMQSLENRIEKVASARHFAFSLA
jgi:hypothetical protein